jgi:hypothetical protein
MNSTEMMETAMQEIMEEQKKNRKLTEQLAGKIDYLQRSIESIKEQKNNGQIDVLSANSSAIFEVKSLLENIQQFVAMQPKNIIHQKRFLLFPEQHAREYYSVILRWIFYIIIASYSYFILKYIIDHWNN